MSITKTFTVTVTGGLGAEKYVIDGVQQPIINLVEGGLYKFDVSDSSNEDLGFRFSSTENGTHNSGTLYTTGVSQSGTPGNSGAYVQIQLASDAPDPLYYFDVNAGTNAGGQINTLSGSSYGTLAWNVNSWGSDELIISLTGVSATSSVGEVTAFNEEGWGRQEWGNSGWGVEYAVQPTGVSATSSVGTLTASQIITAELTGVSATSSVGSLTTDQLTIVTPTGVQSLTELGDFDNAGTLVGWGRNGWGEEPYGDSFNKLIQLSGLSATSSVGGLTLDLTSVISPTGVSATSSVGSLGFVIDSTPVITGVSATSSVGSLSPADVEGLTGVSATSSVGSLSPADAVGLTGLSTTSSVGEIEVVEKLILTPTGQSVTSSVGSIIPEIGVPLTGVLSTASTGTISPTEMAIGLTGLELEATVNGTGIAFPGTYEKLTPKTSTGYTTKTPKTSTGYTIKTPA
jgi:hypothetical protein